jgi:type I restriction enzyme S subunit
MFDGHGEIPFIKVYNLTHDGRLDFSVKPTFVARETHEVQLSRSKARPGDVLMNIVGPPLGKVAIVPTDHPEWNINQAIVCFHTLEGISNKYFAYALLTDSILERVTKLAKATAGQFNIGVNMCRHLLPIPLAPQQEQVRIVAKLDELLSDLDAGVSALERAQANLKRYRSAVLKAAVTGELTAEWRTAHPNVEPATKLLDRILVERRRTWEEKRHVKVGGTRKAPPRNRLENHYEPAQLAATATKDLPAGWCWTSIEQAIQVIDYRGRTPPYSDAGIPHLRSFNIKQGKISWDGITYVTEDTYRTYMTRGLPEAGDLLFTTEAPLGEVALAPTDIRFSMAQRLLLLRPLAGLLDSQYLMYQLMAPDFQARLSFKQTGSTVTGVSSRNFRPLSIRIPPLPEQRAIAEEVERRLSAIAACRDYIQASLKRGGRLRQSILKEAFAGRLVPQDPNDEPASVLLERIQQARSPSSSQNGRSVTRTRKPRQPHLFE